MNTYIAIFIGGGVGSLVRFAISKWITDGFQKINPLGTLVANLLAILVLGITVYFVATKTTLPAWSKYLIVTGFCGGFSTFSTFSYETFELFRNGYTGFAIGNVLVSCVLGVLLLWLVTKF